MPTAQLIYVYFSYFVNLRLITSWRELDKAECGLKCFLSAEAVDCLLLKEDSKISNILAARTLKLLFLNHSTGCFKSHYP